MKTWKPDPDAPLKLWFSDAALEIPGLPGSCVRVDLDDGSSTFDPETCEMIRAEQYAACLARLEDIRA